MTVEPPRGADDEYEPGAEQEGWFDPEPWSEPAAARGISRWSLVMITLLTVALVGVVIAGRVVHNNKQPTARAKQAAVDIHSLNQSVQSLNVQLSVLNQQVRDAVSEAQAKARAAQLMAKQKAARTGAKKVHHNAEQPHG
jgi:uncharacterized membrane protein